MMKRTEVIRIKGQPDRVWNIDENGAYADLNARLPAMYRLLLRDDLTPDQVNANQQSIKELAY